MKLIGLATALLLTTICLESGEPPKPYQYLEPIRPYSEGTIDNYSVHILIKDPYPELWMLVNPSFEPEFCIVLKPKSRDVQGKATSNFDLKFSELKSPLWIHKKGKKPNEYQIVPARKPQIKSMNVAFPEQAAKRISSAWSRTVRQTRYPKDVIFGVDGETYQFYAYPNYFGQIWSPHGEAPLLLVQLGEALIRYVKSSPQDRQAILDTCIELANQLEKIPYD